MASMVWQLTSNKAKVSNRDAVLEIHASYTTSCDDSLSAGQADSADAEFLEFFDEDWPRVLKLETHGLSWENDEDLDKADELMSKMSRTQIIQNFAEMLAEIGPYLTTPLTVQALQYLEYSFPIFACEWHVKPGTNQVEINEFKHSLDKEVIA